MLLRTNNETNTPIYTHSIASMTEVSVEASALTRANQGRKNIDPPLLLIFIVCFLLRVSVIRHTLNFWLWASPSVPSEGARIEPIRCIPHNSFCFQQRSGDFLFLFCTHGQQNQSLLTTSCVCFVCGVQGNQTARAMFGILTRIPKH